jgi:hypothetical protein
MCTAVRLADDDVRVKFGLALIVECDVTDERHQLDLLFDRDLLVVLAGEIEKTQGDAFERSGAGQMCG